MNPKIWRYFKPNFKVYLENWKLTKRIASWNCCWISSDYWFRDGTLGWDIIFPPKYYDRIAKLLSLPLKEKSVKRISNGKRLGEKAIEKDRLGLRKKYEFYNNQKLQTAI